MNDFVHFLCDSKTIDENNWINTLTLLSTWMKQVIFLTPGIRQSLLKQLQIISQAMMKG